MPRRFTEKHVTCAKQDRHGCISLAADLYVMKLLITVLHCDIYLAL